MISAQEAHAIVKFNRDEERAVAKLEAVIDASLHGKFDGSPVKLEFNETITPKIAHAVARKYETGGWRVTVAPGPKSCTFAFISIAATASTVAPKTVEGKRELPPIVTAAATTASPAGKRLLVRMPTRGRPARALAVLEKYRNMAGTSILIEVVIDEDDETMLSAEVQQRLNALGCTITVGQHKSKIEAVNGGRLTEWDILLLASDDMVPITDGYAVRVLSAMEKHWPHLDGAIYFNDGYQKANLCTLPIMGRRLWEQFGRVVYEPSYKSLFSDTEQTAILLAMKRLVYVDELLIEHQHHAIGFPTKDALYDRNDALWSVDQVVCEKRKDMRRRHAQWGFDSPPLWLSICIATVPARREKLERLLDHLYTQIIRDASREVEVLVDSGEGSIGEKRQRLLERARGHFACSIDDDDWISHDYIERVVGALRDNSDTDCASLRGVMTTSGAVPEVFENSLATIEWCTKDGVHYRSPSHLSPVRREIALKVGFLPISHGEDFDYGKRLRPLLKTEASTGEKLLYMYWYEPTKTVR